MVNDSYVYDLAVWLHQQYEDIAADVGWETQEGTSVDFDDLPHENRDVMIRLAVRLLDFGEKNGAVDVHPPGATPDGDDELPEKNELVLYSTDDMGKKHGCVNVWPFWPHDFPVPGDKIELSEGDWEVRFRRFNPSKDAVEVYAQPPEGARG